MRPQITLAFVFAMASAGGTQAHVVLSPGEAPAGGYYFGAFRIGHGCAGAATTRLRIEVPSELVTVRPQPKAGWTLSIEHAPLSAPVRGEGGGMLSQRVSAVTWSGGPLPDEEWDEFGVAMKLPPHAGPLYFPAVQTCEGAQARWTDIPPPGQDRRGLAHPAPMLTVTPAVGPDPMAGMKMGGP